MSRFEPIRQLFNADIEGLKTALVQVISHCYDKKDIAAQQQKMVRKKWALKLILKLATK
jgi:hypothetical protein